MDNAWDNTTNPTITKLVNHYQSLVDAQMNTVIGYATETFLSKYPQSLLTNLTADVIQQYAIKHFRKDIDFAVINVGGLRTPITKGNITVGNIYESFPFDNSVVVLDLPGNAVHELFDSFAQQGGQGVSSGVELQIKDRQKQSLSINGQPVSDDKVYRVATVDYLAEGNDGMRALLQATAMMDLNIMIRDVMIEYIKSCTAEGKQISSTLDNRVVIIHN